MLLRRLAALPLRLAATIESDLIYSNFKASRPLSFGQAARRPPREPAQASKPGLPASHWQSSESVSKYTTVKAAEADNSRILCPLTTRPRA